MCTLPFAANTGLHIHHFALLANMLYEGRTYFGYNNILFPMYYHSPLLVEDIRLEAVAKNLAKIFSVGRGEYRVAVVTFRVTHDSSDWLSNIRLWLGSVAAEMIASANPFAFPVKFLFNTPEWATLSSLLAAESSTQFGSVVNEYLKDVTGWEKGYQVSLPNGGLLGFQPPLPRAEMAKLNISVFNTNGTPPEQLWQQLENLGLQNGKIFFLLGTLLVVELHNILLHSVLYYLRM